MEPPGGWSSREVEANELEARRDSVSVVSGRLRSTMEGLGTTGKADAEATYEPESS